MSEKEWWQTGLGDNVDNAHKKQERRKGPPRFWMPNDTNKEVTFLDDAGFCFWEHNFRANGHFRNWVICLVENKIESRCPFCENGTHAYYVGMFTVIDHDPWEDKKGNVHKDVLKVFPAKTEVLKKI